MYHTRPHNKTFRAWFRGNLRSHARDIAKYGADAGWPKITYTGECCALFDKYADEIFEMLAEDADACGQSTAELMASFGRSDMLASWDTFRNLLVWYACEREARQLIG